MEMKIGFEKHRQKHVKDILLRILTMTTASHYSLCRLQMNEKKDSALL